MATNSNQQKSKTVVVTIFAKDATDFLAVLRTIEIMKNRPLTGLAIKTPIRIMDSDSHNNSFAEGKRPAKGRVCEFQADLRMTVDLGGATMSNCHFIRNSPSIKTDLEAKHDVEIIIQPLDIYNRHKTPGLAAFDMDSTLIDQEVIDELARKVGKYDEVAAVTEAAMRGELDFSESLRARVAKLEGVHTSIWSELKADVITIKPGAREFIKALKGLGWKTVVLSGGFTPLAEWLKEELGLDYAFANHLAMDESGDHLNGSLVKGSRIIDGQAKREIFVQLANDHDIPLRSAIAVGDGSNDLFMMGAAGLGIACNAKPSVQSKAPARLNTSSLLDIMYILGYNDQEIAAAIKASEK